MTEFDLEDLLIDILLHSILFETKVNPDGTLEDGTLAFNDKNGILFKDTDGVTLANKGTLFLSGEVYKNGTRTVINDEDIVVEVLSIDDEQFQNAIVSVRTYVNDIKIGSPEPVPNISRLDEISKQFEKVFKTRSSSYALTTQEFRMKVNSIKRERKADLGQHCVNCLFEFVIRNF